MITTRPGLITLRFMNDDGTYERQRECTLVSDAVAVHMLMASDDIDGDVAAWGVSDVSTGYRYLAFGERGDAIAFAKRLISAFGENPIVGARVNDKANGFAEPPQRFDDLRQFVREERRNALPI